RRHHRETQERGNRRGRSRHADPLLQRPPVRAAAQAGVPGVFRAGRGRVAAQQGRVGEGLMFWLLIAAAAAADAGTPPQPELVPLKQEKKEPAAIEYALSLRQDEWRVHVTLRPGEP